MPQQLPDNREAFTETETDSIEFQYHSDDVNNILVKATWKRGSRLVDDSALSADGETVDESVTVEAKYHVDNGTAELWSFYPDTHKTATGLKRETLKCLRALPHAHDVVDEHTDDDITVVDPYITLRNEIETQ